MASLFGSLTSASKVEPIRRRPRGARAAATSISHVPRFGSPSILRRVPATTPRSGEFIRQKSRFRARPEGGPERHHLYIALACPWSQRTAIVRSVLGLEDRLRVSYLDPYRDERGWAFTGGRFTDDLNGFRFLGEAYEATVENYDGRISVPVLWDREARRVVNNESAEIVRILDDWAGGDLYPAGRRAEIDELNGWIYSELQNGVYRAG